jgi:anti-sigma factor RsiW
MPGWSRTQSKVSVAKNHRKAATFQLMNCTEYEEQIALLITDDLSAAETTLTDQHLKSCAACYQFAEELRESHSFFSQTDAAEFSDALMSAMRHSVMREVARRESASSFWQRLFRPLRWQYAAIALLLLTATFVWFLMKPRIEKQSAENHQTEAPTNRQIEIPAKNHARTSPLIAGADKAKRSALQNLKDVAAEKKLAQRQIVSPEILPPNESAALSSAEIQSIPLESLAKPLSVISLWKASEAESENLPSESLFGADDEQADVLSSEPGTETDLLTPEDENKTLLEIQTRDPNIRIILLAPKETRRITDADGEL